MKILLPKNPYSLRSWTLVGIQAASLLYLSLSAPMRTIRIDLQIWQLSGVFLALAGLVRFNRHTFSIFPEPKPAGILITSGIYSYIRHPMYAGLLVLYGTLLIQFFSWPRLLILLVLAIVFVMKILKEEEFLKGKFPEYADYQQKTNRLIPFLW